MIHFPRNPTILVPLGVVLYDTAGAARAGESATTSLTVICLDSGHRLDDDGTFKASPSSPTITTAALASPFDNLYQHRFDVSAWPRGHFLARFNAAGGQVYQQDFTVGLVADRRLGYAGVYSGSILTLSVWVEENGQVQTDYTSLTSGQLLDASGTQITGGSLGASPSPAAGVFKFTATVTLTANTNYIFDCIANVPGPAGLTAYQFPLRVGVQRP